jgi:hypothetical protein
MAKKEELKIPSSTCEKANGISGRMNIRKHVGGTPDDMLGLQKMADRR